MLLYNALRYMYIYTLQNCSIEKDEAPMVKTAAHLFRRYCYKYRDSRTAGIICAGWDKREGGQVIGQLS